MQVIRSDLSKNCAFRQVNSKPPCIGISALVAVVTRQALLACRSAIFTIFFCGIESNKLDRHPVKYDYFGVTACKG